MTRFQTAVDKGFLTQEQADQANVVCQQYEAGEIDRFEWEVQMVALDVATSDDIDVLNEVLARAADHDRGQKMA